MAFPSTRSPRRGGQRRDIRRRSAATSEKSGGHAGDVRSRWRWRCTGAEDLGVSRGGRAMSLEQAGVSKEVTQGAQDQPVHDADVHELHRLGYAQELLRRMSGFSNFAISFAIICIVAGGITAFGN